MFVFDLQGRHYHKWTPFTFALKDQYVHAIFLVYSGNSINQFKGEQCCEDKNPECFTPGGCFCDSSCRAFDDCCPDFEDHCADKSCLENLRTDIVSNYLRNFRRKPENLKDLPSIASGGQEGCLRNYDRFVIGAVLGIFRKSGKHLLLN